MILVDANILMYAAGAAHPHKQPSIDFLNRVASADIEAAIDAEVLKEILHRYRCLNRWTDGKKVFDLARQLFPDIIAITAEVMHEVRRILDTTDSEVMTRDAVHAAVVIVHKLDGICSFDRHFDQIQRCHRITP